jgi:S-formylglutathione hydrolase FrmB
MPCVASPNWSMIMVAGHPCDLYEPPQPRPGGAVIYLHDLGEEPAPASPGVRRAIEQARLTTLAPRSGRSWWLERIMPGFDRAYSPERFVVEHVRAEVERRSGAGPGGVALVGAGMGGQGALRLAYRHPAIFPVAAAIAPAIDFHMAMRECDLRPDGETFDTLWETYGDVERARQDTAILHVHPLNWPRHQFFASDPADLDWHDGAVRLQSKLRALGIPHTALLSHCGPFAAVEDAHGTAYADRVAAEAIAFVGAALDQESRRLA